MTRLREIELEIDELASKRARLMRSFGLWARSSVERNFDRLKTLSDKIQSLREDFAYWSIQD